MVLFILIASVLRDAFISYLLEWRKIKVWLPRLLLRWLFPGCRTDQAGDHEQHDGPDQ